jgi:hypothetical protein
MPGDPKRCREHAKRCWALASEVTTPVLKESLLELPNVGQFLWPSLRPFTRSSNPWKNPRRKLSSCEWRRSHRYCNAIERDLTRAWKPRPIQTSGLVLHPLRKLCDLLDGEIAFFGRDPHIGSISDAQSVHHELRSLTQRVEMPLVAVPVRSCIPHLIGRHPMHVSGEIKVHPLRIVGRLELCLHCRRRSAPSRKQSKTPRS